MTRKTYTARCERAGDWWAISVPELRGVHTQARRLENVDATVRDAIALFLDVRPDSFEIKIEPVLPRELQKKVGRARKVRGEAEALERQAAAVSMEVAADLVQRAHLTMRDAGRYLGFPISVSRNCSRLAALNGGEATSAMFLLRATAKTAGATLDNGGRGDNCGLPMPAIERQRTLMNVLGR